jgi:putative FmdB family regulatory protein
MPIYAYRCESCGFEKDVLQKLSDSLLTQCPECGKDTFRKQVTAAGFQLKGSGWYVTDFRGGNSGAKAAGGAGDAGGSAADGAGAAKSGDAAGSDGAAKTSASDAAVPAAPSGSAAP